MTERQAITDHALLRYLERVKGLDVARARAPRSKKTGRPLNDHEVLKRLEKSGLDIESIRHSLLTPNVSAAIAVGAKSVVCGDHRFVIRNSVVVTTAPVTELRAMRPCLRKGQARGLREKTRVDLRHALEEFAE